MESDPRLALTWCSSWPDFLCEIYTHFRPSNPTGTAEIKLHHLSMQSDSHILEYLVRFNTLASRVYWGDVALRFQFYDGLPERLKEKVAILGKPESLREMVNVTVHYDTLYWERQTERRLTCRFDPKPTLSRPSKPLHTLTNTLLPTNHNSVSTPCQPGAP